MAESIRGARSSSVAIMLAACAFALAVPAASALDDAPAPPTGKQLDALTVPRPPSQLAGQRIYFLLTDRFENGDRANDRGGRSGGFAVTGYEPTDPAAYHGGDLRGLIQRLDHIERLGATAIWVTPPFVQRTVQGSTAGYHGYWGVDFTRIDPHLGTNDEFRAFVDLAHERGLRVILDVVANHTGDVIAYQGAGAAGAPYVEQQDRPYRDIRGRPFDPARNAGKPTFPRMYPDRRSFPYQPVVRRADHALKRPAWLNDVRNYHNRGDSTFQGESVRYGDFYGLDDLFTEKPEVVRGLIDLYSGWIRTYRLDGFRLDTARHVNDAFLRAFVPAVTRAVRVAARAARPPASARPRSSGRAPRSSRRGRERHQAGVPRPGQPGEPRRRARYGSLHGGAPAGHGGGGAFYSPVHSGGRFSVNAATPSRKSWVCCSRP